MYRDMAKQRDVLKAQHEAALRQVEKMKRLLTHPHDVDVKQADCPACRWDELAEVTRKYHEAMDVLTAYDKIDHATALAQLAEAQRELARSGLKRNVKACEAIEIGPCECGD